MSPTVKKIFIISALILCIILGYTYVTISINNSDRYRAKQLISGTFPQYHIDKQFDTGLGLQGFILSSKDQPSVSSILFTTKNGKYIVDGNVYAINSKTKQAVNLNNQYLTLRNTDDKSEIFLKNIQNSYYIQQGSDSAPHQMYAVIDPSCPYCHALF